MTTVDPKQNEVVLKLNKLTQDGRIHWTRMDPEAEGLFRSPERYKTSYRDKHFIVSAPDPATTIFGAFSKRPGQRALACRLELTDSRDQVLLTFPLMTSVDDLFMTVRQGLEKQKVDKLLDEFLNEF